MRGIGQSGRVSGGVRHLSHDLSQLLPGFTLAVIILLIQIRLCIRSWALAETLIDVPVEDVQIIRLDASKTHRTIEALRRFAAAP